MGKTTRCVLLLSFVRHVSCQDLYEWVSAGAQTTCHSSEKLNDECTSARSCTVFNTSGVIETLSACQSICSRSNDCGVDYRPGTCNVWKPAPKYFQKKKDTIDRQCWKRVPRGKIRSLHCWLCPGISDLNIICVLCMNIELGPPQSQKSLMQLFNYPFLVLCGPRSSIKCEAKTVFISGYSTGDLVRISNGVTNGLQVAKAGDRNSCPKGYKLWSPRTKADWTAVYNAMGQDIDNYPGKSGMIVDVFRTQDGCGGCGDDAMNSNVSEQSSWQTSDGSAWWLRDTPYTPGGSYRANRLLTVIDVNPNDVKFTYPENLLRTRKSEYFCQTTSTASTFRLSIFVGAFSHRGVFPFPFV